MRWFLYISIDSLSSGVIGEDFVKTQEVDLGIQRLSLGLNSVFLPIR